METSEYAQRTTSILNAIEDAGRRVAQAQGEVVQKGVPHVEQVLRDTREHLRPAGAELAGLTPPWTLVEHYGHLTAAYVEFVQSIVLKLQGIAQNDVALVKRGDMYVDSATEHLRQVEQEARRVAGD